MEERIRWWGGIQSSSLGAFPHPSSLLLRQPSRLSPWSLCPLSENSLPTSTLSPQSHLFRSLLRGAFSPLLPLLLIPRHSLASDTTTVTVLFIVQITIPRCSILPLLIHHYFMKVCRNAVCFVQGPTSDGHSFNEPLLNK